MVERKILRLTYILKKGFTMKKLFLTVLLASFVFVACSGDDDNSVSASGETLLLTDAGFSCKVESGESWARQTIVVSGEFEGFSEMAINGSSATASVMNRYLNRSPSELNKICEKFEDQSDYFDEGSFKCADGVVTYSVTIPRQYANSLSNVVEEMKEECYEYERDWKENGTL